MSHTTNSIIADTSSEDRSPGQGRPSRHRHSFETVLVAVAALPTPTHIYLCMSANALLRADTLSIFGASRLHPVQLLIL